MSAPRRIRPGDRAMIRNRDLDARRVVNVRACDRSVSTDGLELTLDILGAESQWLPADNYSILSPENVV